MLARLLRDAPEQWVKKGGRGRSAHHLDSRDLACFIIAMMACPDSPALALDRLPHFAALPYDSKKKSHKATFAEALALILQRIAREDWEAAQGKDWSVKVAIHTSTALISENFGEGEDASTVEHYFSSLVDAAPDEPMKNAVPYYSGLSCIVEIDCITLFRIAKVVLENEADPLGEMLRSLGVGD